MSNSPWVKWGGGGVVAVTAISIVVGFVWLPAQHKDFTAQGLWLAICRAAGVPERWAGADPPRASVRSTLVVVDRELAHGGQSDAVGRGATLALRCTMCHGAHGMGEANAPNLAGQYHEVLVKQLIDYKNGDRASAVMQALAAALSDRDIRDLATYYAYLPRPKNVPVTDMSEVPALVKVGDPMRNIAPCASCHGGMDQKLGAPWLEGMPKAYLVEELTQFAAGTRHNDALAQMRNMARTLTRKEIEDVSDFFARHGEGEGTAH